MDSIIWTLVVVMVTSYVMESKATNRAGLIVTAPNTLVQGKDEKICVSFHDINFDVATTTLISQQDVSGMRRLFHRRVNFNQGTSGCFSVNIDNVVDQYEQLELNFTAQGMGADGHGYAFKDSVKVAIRMKQDTQANVTFIELDKPKYKPGDEVKFRVLTIQEELKPRTENIALVYVANPGGVRMIQWKDINVEATHGLADFAFELSEDPMKGEWKVYVKREDGNTEQKTFSVEEYVLPKFSVTVTPPVYVPINAESVEAEVCALYTYGEPVKGNLTVEMSIQTPSYYYRPNTFDSHIRSFPISGCRKVPVPIRDLLLDPTGTTPSPGRPVPIDTSQNYNLRLYSHYITIKATVEEEDTGVVLSGVKDTPEFGYDVYKIEFEDVKKYYKPGFPFTGKVKVTRPDGSKAADVQVQLSHDGNSSRGPEMITTDSSGIARFTWTDLALKKHNKHITITASIKNLTFAGDIYANYLRKPSEIVTIKSWYSPSDSYLVIDEITETVECGGMVSAQVRYNRGHGRSLHYQLVTQSSLVEEGETQRTHGNDTSLSLTLPDGVWGESSLLVFYVRPDGEIVADSANFNVKQCINNKVSMSFSQPEVFPGRDIDMEISAAPGSMCGYGVVDESIRLLGTENSVTMAQVLDHIPVKTAQRQYNRFMDEYCMNKIEEEAKEEEKKKEESKKGRNGRRRGHRRDNRRRKPRSFMPYYPVYSRYVDSSEAFKNPLLTVMTDLRLDTRPCEDSMNYGVYAAMPEYAYSAPMMPRMSGRPGPVFDNVVDMPVDLPIPDNSLLQESSKVVVNTIRTYFPETWLWALAPVDSSGVSSVSLKAPDTITEWHGHAICSHGDVGIGITPMATLKTFQPFFVSFTLPYSMIRGETLYLPVSVFNYLTECLVVELTMEASAQYEITSGSRSARLCVCGQEKKSHKFPITATTLGNINLTVVAESVNEASVCGNAIMSSQYGVRDKVVRELLVEPEGKEQVYTYSSFVCPKNGMPQMDSASLVLPEDAITDSAKGYVTVIGDVMGPALSGLDALIRLPTGCGEQTMLSFAPNVYILQYLQHSNQLTAATEEKSLKFLRSGYQREMTYRHTDGSYSAFGLNDDSGSTWLSAFVLKSFSQAKAFIDIDQNDLDVTTDWFRKNQRENGCYVNVGRVIHKSMQGGLQAGSSPAPLTAYIMAALLESGFQSEDFMVSGAAQCLQALSDSDVYTTALAAYAASLWKRDHQLTDHYMMRLNDAKIVDGGYAFWRGGEVSAGYHGAMSIDVEVTAYALLAMLAYSPDPKRELDTILPVVRWLTAQRNPEGGFKSTQDTVVGLQALSKFASIVAQRDGEFAVTVQQSATRDEFVFLVSQDNQLILQREPVVVPNNLTFVSSGESCALVQASMKYNIRNVTAGSKQSITMKVITSRTPDNNCRQRDLEICVTYNGPDDNTNMAILDVKMVTGWVPIEETVAKLMQDTTLNLGRYELEKKNVFLYFNELPREQLLCPTFRVEQDVEVRDAKPGQAYIFDYYDEENVNFQTPYSLRTTCGTKEELPFVVGPQPELDPNQIEQARVPDPEFPFAEVGSESAGCADCMDINAAVDQETLKEAFCTATHVYKAVVKKHGDVKVQRDLMLPKKDSKINLPVKITEEEECTCGTLTERGTQILIVTKSSTIEKTSRKKGALLLTGDDRVFVTQSKTKSVEKLLKKTKKSKRCRT